MTTRLSEAPWSQRPNLHLPYEQQSRVHHRVVARLARQVTPRGGRVVDVGCGLGHTLLALRRLDSDLVLHAADADAHCLEVTAERVSDVRILRMAGDELDVSGLGGGYDTCILSHVLEHLPHPSDAIGRLLGLLRHGGHLVVAVPNPVRPSVILTNLLRRRAVNPGHLQSWDRSHWMNFLERREGAEVVVYASDEIRLLPRRIKALVPLIESLQVGLVHLLPWFSFSNIAVMRRAGSR